MVSLRTQQIVHLESGVGAVADPLGGSYYVEELTDQIEQRILGMIETIESMGPLKDLTEGGWFRDLFQDAMTRRVQAIQDESQIQVGVNAFTIPDEEDTLLRDQTEAKIEPYWDRIDEIRRFKETRDQGPVRDHFARLRDEVAAPGINLIPLIADALEANLTHGEISGALRLGVGASYDPLGSMEPPL